MEHNVSGVIFQLSTPSESLFEIRWGEKVKVGSREDVEKNILALNDTFAYKLKNLRAKAYRILNEHAVKVGGTYVVPKCKLPILIGRLERLRDDYRQLDEEVIRWISGEGRERVRDVERYISAKTGEENVRVEVKPTADRLRYSFTDFRLDDGFVKEFMNDIVSEAEAYARAIVERAEKEKSEITKRVMEEYERGMEALHREIQSIRERKMKELENSIIASVKEALQEFSDKKSPVEVKLQRLKENVEALGLKCEALDLAVKTVKGDVEASKRLAEYFGVVPTDDLNANVASVAGKRGKHVLLTVQP